MQYWNARNLHGPLQTATEEQEEGRIETLLLHGPLQTATEAQEEDRVKTANEAAAAMRDLVRPPPTSLNLFQPFLTPCLTGPTPIQPRLPFSTCLDALSV